MGPLEKHIRLYTNIFGFQIVPKEHKINLFAGDVILMITDPITSLASVQSVLQWFSNISYYKVNESNLDLGLDGITSNLLRNMYSWADSYFLPRDLPSPKNIFLTIIMQK